MYIEGVNVVLVMAYGSLFFVLLFIFVKRQVVRLTMKSRTGPHVPIGHNAPKELRTIIEAKIGLVQKIQFEPRLLCPDDERLNKIDHAGSYDYLYRMKALDAIRDLDFPFHELGVKSTGITGKKFRTWLLQLRNSNLICSEDQYSIVDSVLDGYNKARHLAEVFGEAEFLKYIDALTQLAPIVNSFSLKTSFRHHHHAAAKNLAARKASTSGSSPPIQTSLTPPRHQRLRRTWNFLEMRNYKDKYNTLDTTY